MMTSFSIVSHKKLTISYKCNLNRDIYLASRSKASMSCHSSDLDEHVTAEPIQIDELNPQHCQKPVSIYSQNI